MLEYLTGGMIQNNLFYFWIWAVVNILAGLWEIYAYSNRSQLSLTKTTLWQNIADGKVNIANFWIHGWSEYCKVDSRYIIKSYVCNEEIKILHYNRKKSN